MNNQELTNLVNIRSILLLSILLIITLINTHLICSMTDFYYQLLNTYITSVINVVFIIWVLISEEKLVFDLKYEY